MLLFGASLTEDVRVFIYNCNMFIIQATGGRNCSSSLCSAPVCSVLFSLVHSSSFSATENYHYSWSQNGMKSDEWDANELWWMRCKLILMNEMKMNSYEWDANELWWMRCKWILMNEMWMNSDEWDKNEFWWMRCK